MRDVRLVCPRWFLPILLSSLCLLGSASHAANTETSPSLEPSQLHNVSTEQTIMLALDVSFLFGGIIYGSRVLAPKPMTYLSEIAFPTDVRCTVMAHGHNWNLLMSLLTDSFAGNWQRRSRCSC